LRAAEASEVVVVLIATLIDLWYVTQATQRVSATELADLRLLVAGTPAVSFHPVDVEFADAYTGISRDLLRDPWDRLIVATALALHLAAGQPRRPHPPQRPRRDHRSLNRVRLARPATLSAVTRVTRVATPFASNPESVG
jgi:hypothetical protein